MVPGTCLPVLHIQMKNCVSACRYFFNVDGRRIVSRSAPTFSLATLRWAFAAAVLAALARCEALFFLLASALATAGRGRAALALSLLGAIVVLIGKFVC